MSVREAYAERPVCDDFGEHEVGGFDVEVALHDLEVGCYAAQELEGFFIRDVAQAEDLADFAGRKQFLKLE